LKAGTCQRCRHGDLSAEVGRDWKNFGGFISGPSVLRVKPSWPTTPCIPLPGGGPAEAGRLIAEKASIRDVQGSSLDGHLLECDVMKLSERSVLLKERELLLFKYLFESDFLTRSQIQQYIYPEARQYFPVRLWQLTKEEYVKKLAHPLGKLNETLIMADYKALEALRFHRAELKTLKRRDNFRFRDFNPEEDYRVQSGLDMRSFSHDLLLNDIRFLLENAGANYYRTQKMITREKLIAFTPDGLFEKRKSAYAIELEIARKDIERYKEIFKRYAMENKVDYVLYLADDGKVYNRLASLINQKTISYSIDAYKKFYLIRLDDFLRGDWHFVNPSAEQLRFDLKEVLQ
jgi:hypothetical protein